MKYKYKINMFDDFSIILNKTRTKTSIRYAKENDREKRERKVEGKI